MNRSGDALASRLVDLGLRESERDAKALLFRRVLKALTFARGDARVWWVPGRIEFLGKHTDYAGGPSLLCAVERGFAVGALPREDRGIGIVDAASGERIEAALASDTVVRRAHWANYPLTVVRRAVRNFPELHRGMEVAFASDLPPAAGLSSSSALIVAMFLALADANELATCDQYRENIENSEDLAGYLGAVENGSGFRGLGGDLGVGTQGGSEDHTAILCARPGALVQYSFAPIRLERTVPLPDDLVFVVAASGVVAEKTGGAREQYNRAAALAQEALHAWRDTTGSTAASLAAALGELPNAEITLKSVLRERADDDAEQLLHYSDVARRLQQFTAEAAFVRAAGDALVRGDLDLLGRIVDSSQMLAEFTLDNQVPETIDLADSARELGALAASAFGAGFGGSVYALVHATEASEFLRRWAAIYSEAYPARREAARFFISAPGLAATRL